MEGIGIYSWQDGRKYEGEYKEDKKHGYGIYTWADLREYHGWWYRGKQHGLGVYFVPNNDMRHGLWEDGKRIEWFEANVAKQIMQGEFDFTTMFKRPESVQLAYNSKFSKPNNFDS